MRAALADLRRKLPLERLPLERLRLQKPELARLKKRLQPRSALAITLEADRIAVAQVRLHLDDDGHTIIPAASVPVGAEDVFRNPEKAGGLLGTMLEAAGLRDKRCAVCLPPGWALTASTDLPAVSPDDLRGYLELRAEREFPIALAELRLGYCPYTLPDGTRRATLAALPSRRLEAVEKLLAASGRRAISISLALGDCLADGATGEPTLYFLAEPGHTDVAVTAGGGVAALRALPGPDAAKEETESAALPLTPGPDTAAFDPATFARELRITLGRLPHAISQGVRRARFAGETHAARRLRIELGGALERMGITSIEEALEAPAAPVEKADGALLSAAAASANGRSRTSTETAAYQALRRQAVPFDFVVPLPRKWEAAFVRYNTRRYRWIAGVAAALVFLPMLLFFVRSEYEDHLATQWSEMQSNVNDLDALQQKIRKFRPWFEPVPQGLQVLESLFAAFPEAGDVWAKSIQLGTGGKVTCTGFAHNQKALLAMLDRLRARPDVSGVQVQQIRGDNPVQFSFVYKAGSAR